MSDIGDTAGAPKRRRWVVALVLVATVIYGAVPRLLVYWVEESNAVTEASSLAEAFTEVKERGRVLSFVAALPLHREAALDATWGLDRDLRDAAERHFLDPELDRVERGRALWLAATIREPGSEPFYDVPDAHARGLHALWVLPEGKYGHLRLARAAEAALTEGWAARSRRLVERAAAALPEMAPEDRTYHASARLADAALMAGRVDLSLTVRRESYERIVREVPHIARTERVALCATLAATGAHAEAARIDEDGEAIPVRAWYLLRAGKRDEATALLEGSADDPRAGRHDWTWARLAVLTDAERWEDALALLPPGGSRSHAIGDAYVDIFRAFNGIYFPPLPIELVRDVRTRVERRMLASLSPDPRLRLLLARALFVEARLAMLNGRDEAALTLYERMWSIAPDYRQGLRARLQAIELLRGPSAALAAIDEAGTTGEETDRDGDCRRFGLLVRAERWEEAQQLHEADPDLCARHIREMGADPMALLRARLASGLGDTDAAARLVALATDEELVGHRSLVKALTGSQADLGRALDYIHLSNAGSSTRGHVYLLEGLGERREATARLVLPRWIGRVSQMKPSGGMLATYLLSRLGTPPTDPTVRQRKATFGRAYNRHALLLSDRF